MSIKSNIFLTAASCVLFAFKGYADDTSLYAEPAPSDASFVRFIGFEGNTSAEYAGNSFALSETDMAAYVPVSSTKLTDVPVGSYVSVLRSQDNHEIAIFEGPRDSRTKVHLFLVNGTDTPLDLRLADNSATVIDGVAGGAAGQRGVNPLAVTLGVFEDGSDTAIATFDVNLKRGQNISFVADALGVRLIENRYGAVAK